MIPHAKLLLALWAVSFCIASTTAQPKVKIASESNWITPYTYDENLPDTAVTEKGYHYLFVNIQNNLEAKEYYRRYATKVLTDQGLSVVSEINEMFEPSFQQITFHTLFIKRNGKVINKLDVDKLELIRREEQMDRAVYDKSVSVVYNLPDVRIGDIVEYSFTIKGVNPIFSDHRFGTLYLQYRAPVSKFAAKILYNKNRNLSVITTGDAVVHREGISGNLNYHEWIHEQVPPIKLEESTPSWYDPYARVQYSDMTSWQEVKSWTKQVFTYPPTTNKELKSVIAEILAMENQDEKIKACIKLVQSEIRYLSFSDGIHSYKPHHPDQVYTQRYGDCKDKSLLLTHLLNNIGIESYPALVSTDNGYTLPSFLPNPWAFNHCIVKFIHNDSTYWIDPTLNAQIGPLKKFFFPTYDYALVADGDTTGLEAIPFGYKNSVVAVDETYSMDEIGGFVTLKVKTEYFGDEAQEMRTYFSNNSIASITKKYLNFYADDYSEISATQSVKFEVDSSENILRSYEEYLIKDFWEINSEAKRKEATVFPGIIASYIKKPATPLRSMPLTISHPREIYHNITIKLPEDWSITEHESIIESDAFRYETSSKSGHKKIELRYHYKSKVPFIEVEQVRIHLKYT